MRNVLIVAVALVGAGVGAWLLLRSLTPKPAPDAPAGSESAVWFEDVAAKAGVNFQHFDPATPAHLIPETMGSGVAWIDYDADGWPDLFCVQGGQVPPAAPDPTRTHKLYRNNRDGTFTDVTAAVGLATPAGLGTGVAVADVDGDGSDDLVVASLGGLSLFLNVPDPAAPGGRRFRDATAASGLADPHYATSLALADLDGDGKPDLYVCNYVTFDPLKPLTCVDPARNIPIQCSPTVYPHVAHKLFKNTGGGTFADVTASSGVGSAPPAPGLAVLILDLDGDGKPDIYVANDMRPSYLFRNLGGMRFEEVALVAGAALGPQGDRIAGMGIAAIDADGSGRPSLFVTNFQRQPNVLFLNRGNMRFDDASMSSGLGGPSLERLKFGTCVLDADLDGFPDLAVANGHVQRPARELYGVGYAQEMQLFLGGGAGKFRDASAAAGADFLKPRVGRGLASADFDADGRPDLAVTSVGGPAALLRNRAASGHGWVSLDLVGDAAASGREAFGAAVRAEWAGTARTHFLPGGGSYLSAGDRRLTVGLGTAGQLDRASVRWPSGRTQEFGPLPANTRWRLREGNPQPEPVHLPTR